MCTKKINRLQRHVTLMPLLKTKKVILILFFCITSIESQLKVQAIIMNNRCMLIYCLFLFLEFVIIFTLDHTHYNIFIVFCFSKFFLNINIYILYLKFPVVTKSVQYIVGISLCGPHGFLQRLVSH